jgi:hypothetical protein
MELAAVVKVVEESPVPALPISPSARERSETL